MRKFLFMFLKSSFLIIIGSALLSALILKVTEGDYYTDNEAKELIQKLDVFKNDTIQYNTVFIGTSRSYRHISPVIFDTITGETSYNLAYGGLYPFRSYDLINKYLKKVKKYKGVKNVFIELSLFDPIHQNFNNRYFKNSITLKKYFIVVKTALVSMIPIENKLSYIYYYSMLFLCKYTGMGLIDRINQYFNLNKPYTFIDKESLLYNKLMKTNKGFLSNDDEQMFFLDNRISSTRKEFMKDTHSILTQLKKIYSDTPINLKVDDFDQYIIRNALNLQQAGKKVYFIVPPRQRNFATQYSLRQKEILKRRGFNVFDFSDPKVNPNFYLEENSFDRMHLNAKGARIYSEILSRQYLSLLK